MKNTFFISVIFSLLLMFSCRDERDTTDTADVPPLQEGLNRIQGSPPDEIAPQPRTEGDPIDRVSGTESTATTVTDREIEQYVKINRRVEKLNIQEGQDSNTEMNRIATEEGLSMRRYQEIGVALQNDPTLQDKMTRYQNENRQ